MANYRKSMTRKDIRFELLDTFRAAKNAGLKGVELWCCETKLNLLNLVLADTDWGAYGFDIDREKIVETWHFAGPVGFPDDWIPRLWIPLTEESAEAVELYRPGTLIF